MSEFTLTINRQASILSAAVVRSATDLSPISFPQLVIGNNRPFRVQLVSNGEIDALSGDAQTDLFVSIGSPCSKPTGGTFTFTRGANTTSALAYNVATAALQTALEGLASIGAGNVLVSGVAGNFYRIEYIGSLADTDIDNASASGDLLTPTSTADLQTLVVGGSGNNAVQILRLKQVPAVYQATWTPDGDSWVGTLSTGTYEALLALAAQSPYVATLEVSIKLQNGNVETLAQVAATVLCDVGLPDQFVPGTLPQYLTGSQVTAKFATANTVWVSKSGNDSTGTRGRFDLPFLTVGAAIAAQQSGDTIHVLTGDYSAENISGTLGTKVYCHGEVEFPSINQAGWGIEVHGAYLTGTYAIASGNPVAQFFNCRGEGFKAEVGGGSLRFYDCRFFEEDATAPVITDNGVGSNLQIVNCHFVMTCDTGVSTSVISIEGGTLAARDSSFKITVGADENATGILSDVNVRLQNCVIKTVVSGSGVAKSIDTNASIDAVIQGTLAVSHALEGIVTPIGGSVIVNTAFDGFI